LRERNTLIEKHNSEATISEAKSAAKDLVIKEKDTEIAKLRQKVVALSNGLTSDRLKTLFDKVTTFTSTKKIHEFKKLQNVFSKGKR